jgi:hypothetical protein
LMEMRGVMFRALSRVNTLFIIYHSHAPAGRGLGGDRPRPGQSPMCCPNQAGVVCRSAKQRNMQVQCKQVVVCRPIRERMCNWMVRTLTAVLPTSHTQALGARQYTE